MSRGILWSLLVAGALGVAYFGVLEQRSRPQPPSGASPSPTYVGPVIPYVGSSSGGAKKADRLSMPQEPVPESAPADDAAARRALAEALAAKAKLVKSAAVSTEAESEIAAVLADPDVRKRTDAFRPDDLRELDRVLAFFKQHRDSVSKDLESLKHELIELKVSQGDVQPFPKSDGVEVQKPAAPSDGARHVGWAHPVGDVSYWVMVTEKEYPEYFDLMDLARDPEAFLRSRILRIGLREREGG
jgi:hypothetical protein